ncbi:MAG TPA: hypothetical protein VGN44_20970 [Candidatus Angelobacter sp.]|jgi:hypothetical protein
MAITLDQIAEIHPILYHMAEKGTWPSLEKHGLLSTTALLDLFGVSGKKRIEIEEMRRPKGVEISHLEHGRVFIRDQKPMHDSKLASCLRDGLTPQEWLKILNDKVFFWLTEERLHTLMKAYADRGHLILEIDTAALLKQYGSKVSLTPLNTGSTSPFAHPRGLNSFLPPDRYPFEENRRKKGSRSKAIVELTVDHSVCDIRKFTKRATHRSLTKNAQSKIIELVYSV